MKRSRTWVSFVAVVTIPFALTACGKLKSLFGGGDGDAGVDGSALLMQLPDAAVVLVDPPTADAGAPAAVVTTAPTGVVVVRKPDGGVLAVDAGAAPRLADGGGVAPIPTPTLTRPAIPSGWPSGVPTTLPTTLPTTIPTIPPPPKPTK